MAAEHQVLLIQEMVVMLVMALDLVALELLFYQSQLQNILEQQQDLQLLQQVDLIQF